MIRLKKLLLIVLLFACVFDNTLKAQNSKNDTLKIEPVMPFLKDSLVGASLFGIADTVENKDAIKFVELDSVVEITIRDTAQLVEDGAVEISFEDYMKQFKDSLIFEEADSIHFVINNLNKVIRENGSLITDSTKQAVGMLIKYYQSREIEAATNYLKNTIGKSFYVPGNKDSSKAQLADSINNAIRYLLNNISKDSLNLLFTNTINDSILLKSAKNEMDSIHIRLADNRGEYAILWIKKSGEGIFSIFLEDGVYINKVEQQQFLKQKFRNEIKRPKLRKVNKVDLIIPIWKFDGLADVRFNQGYVSESWAEGGENSMSALSVFKYSADYTYGKKRNLDTDVEYKLGYLKTGTNSLKKNDDRFEINAKYGKSAFNNWYYGFY